MGIFYHCTDHGVVKGGAPRGGSAPAAKAKRVVIDFPQSLFNAAEDAALELQVNRGSPIREAVKQFVGELHRRKLEKELADGFIANAASARIVADEMRACSLLRPLKSLHASVK